MRLALPFLLAASLLGLTSLAAQQAQQKKAAQPPAKLVFQAKTGNVTFDHAAHVKREKNNCKICHNALFRQDAKAPLNFKAAMHKTAEAKQTSCGFCHRPGGAAFASQGNCNRCHTKGTKG